jgi:hypothetical protein
MTIVKEKNPTSFEVEQNLQTMNGARTVTLDTKTGHLFTMSQETWAGPAPRRRTRAAGHTSTRVIYDSNDRAVRSWSSSTLKPASPEIDLRILLQRFVNPSRLLRF